MIRKTSLLRIVPTACGQAADICTEPIRIGAAISSRRDFHRGQLGRVQCSEIAYRSQRHVAIEFSERSYLFTISDITRPHQAISPVTGAELSFRRTSWTSISSSKRNDESKPDDPGWWSQTGSNRRPPACKAGALPTELWPLQGTGIRSQ